VAFKVSLWQALNTVYGRDMMAKTSYNNQIKTPDGGFLKRNPAP
jgi:hypothetical protein